MNEYETKRCCGNCEWSISPICEKDIMIENHYDEDDPNRPRAGDCCLGMDHNGEYVCSQHDYLSGGLSTSIFYDDRELGPGFYVLDEYYDDIIRFFKLYRFGTYDNYNYGIRAYEICPRILNGNRNIVFEFNESEYKELYEVFYIAANSLGKSAVVNCENNNDCMTMDIGKYGVFLNFSKNITDVSNDSKFIDIVIRCNKDDRNYKLIEILYRNLAVLTMNKKDENNMKKVRTLLR